VLKIEDCCSEFSSSVREFVCSSEYPEFHTAQLLVRSYTDNIFIHTVTSVFLVVTMFIVSFNV